MPPELGMNVVASVIGALVFVLLGVVITQVKTGLLNVSKEIGGVRVSVDKLNGRLYGHVTDAECHEAGIARVEEQVKGAENVGKAAHKRLDVIQRTPQQRQGG